MRQSIRQNMNGPFLRGAWRLGARLGAVLLALSLAACSSILGGNGVLITQTGEGQVSAVPAGTDPEDAVIGRREHPLIVAAYGGVYSHQRTEIMLARIVSRLLGAANQSQTSFTITILDSPQVNAFALPGGYIYVTRGILALANDSSELAAVLAHEIAHVTLRHARARTSLVATSELVDRVITGVLGGDPETDQTVARSRLSLAAFSQAQELAADEEGVKIAGLAGYDPHAAGRFLGTMARFSNFAEGGSEGGDDFLATHPSTPNRIQRAVQTARSFGAPGLGETDRAGYLAAIDGIAFGDNPEEGIVVGQQFIHPALKFTFTAPARYTLQNSPTAVVGIAGDGEAVRFDSAEVPQSMALTDYLKSGWIAGLDGDSVVSESHNGVEMASGVARTDEWSFRVTAVRFGGEVYRFIFAARENSSAFINAAEETIKSFRRVRGGDLRSIRTVSVEIVTARRGETADTLASRMGRIPDARETFYILNNLFAGDELIPGQSYKIVSVK